MRFLPLRRRSWGQLFFTLASVVFVNVEGGMADWYYSAVLCSRLNDQSLLQPLGDAQ